MNEYVDKNISIAKFIGWKVALIEDIYRIFKPGSLNYTSTRAISGWYEEDLAWRAIGNKCQYHVSWDQLMPVVEKIEKLGLSTDIHYYAAIKLGKHCTTFLGYKFEYSRNIFSNSKIDSVYQNVVEFIKWYSKNKADDT